MMLILLWRICFSYSNRLKSRITEWSQRSFFFVDLRAEQVNIPIDRSFLLLTFDFKELRHYNINFRLMILSVRLCITLLLFAIGYVQANVWDNIFSSTLASSPIILSDSLNFKFPINYNDMQFQGSVDFNKDLKLLTVSAAKTLFTLNIDVFSMQIDLEHFLITISNVLSGCEKYKLVLSEDDKTKGSKIQLQSKAFLINLLFEYKQRGKFDNTLSEYVLMPDLMMKHEEEHEEYEINTLVVVDKKGRIVKIYEDQDKKKEIPFSLKSKVNRKLQCEGEVQQLTKEDLYEKLKSSLENKDYEKIPGFDATKIPKIPGITDFDISKLPKPK